MHFTCSHALKSQTTGAHPPSPPQTTTSKPTTKMGEFPPKSRQTPIGIPSTTNRQITAPTHLNLVPQDYWVHVARHVDAARLLMGRMSLDFPSLHVPAVGLDPIPFSERCSIYYPLRRLIITGEDTDQNFRLLFGRRWQQVLQVHADLRYYILERSPPSLLGSWDLGCQWSPRPLNDLELEECRMYEYRILYGGI